MTGDRSRSASAPVTYLRLYADDDGESHFEQRALGSASDATVVGPGLLDEGEASRYRLRLVPPGWVREWGPSRERTLAAYLSGEGIVEASDGERRWVGPGVMLLAEDTSGRGHRAHYEVSTEVTSLRGVADDITLHRVRVTAPAPPVSDDGHSPAPLAAVTSWGAPTPSS